MDYGQILYEVTDGVALVTLNRPEKLNAMTAQMGAEMDDAMAEADSDEAVRAVVVTGAGAPWKSASPSSRPSTAPPSGPG